VELISEPDPIRLGHLCKTKALPIFYLGDLAIREDELVIGSDDWRHMNNRSFVANNVREDPAVFAGRFWRSYRLLHLIACRILDGPEQADEAIDNCWQTASRGCPRFEYEGAFRSWLARVLIDEALLLRKNHKIANHGSAEDFRREYMRAAE
jgi:hypothetical protein